MLAFTVGLFLTKCLMQHIMVDAEDTLSCVDQLVPKRPGHVLAALVGCSSRKGGVRVSFSIHPSIHSLPAATNYS